MKKTSWLIILLIIILIIILMSCLFDGESEKWENIRITDSSGQSSEPVAVWDGSGYGIVWNDARDDIEWRRYTDVYFAKIDKNGKKLISDINISNAVDIDTGNPVIAWTGEEYGIMWSEFTRWPDDCNLYFTRLDADGNKIGDDIVITSGTVPNRKCPYDAIIEWTGSEYGILWRETAAYDYQIYFNRLNAVGEKQGDDIPVSGFESNRAPSMDWMGSGYGVAWEGFEPSSAGSVISFTRIDANGVKQIEDVRVSDASTSRCTKISSIAWNDSNENFGLAWSEFDDNDLRQIYFAILDQDGNKQVENIMLTDSDEYSSNSSTIAWADRKSEYGIAWNQHNNATGEDLIKFAVLDVDGDMKGEAVQVSNFANSTTTLRSKNPSIVWNGKSYGIFWDDYRDNNNGREIYFASSYSCWVTDVFNNIKDFITGLF